MCIIVSMCINESQSCKLAVVGGRWSREMNLRACCVVAVEGASRWHTEDAMQMSLINKRAFHIARGRWLHLCNLHLTFTLLMKDKQVLSPPFLKAFQLLSGWHLVWAFKGPMFWVIYLKTLSVSENQAYLQLCLHPPGKTKLVILLEADFFVRLSTSLEWDKRKAGLGGRSQHQIGGGVNNQGGVTTPFVMS